MPSNSMSLMSASLSCACVISVGGTMMLRPGSSPASSIARARTDTRPTTAGLVAAVAAQLLPGSRIATMKQAKVLLDYAEGTLESTPLMKQMRVDVQGHGGVGMANSGRNHMHRHTAAEKVGYVG